MGIDGRRKPRRGVPGMVDVTDTMTGEVVGCVGNVSAGGMLLICNRRLVPDGLFQFRFALPTESGDPEWLETGAHVLWQDEHGAPGQHWIGLRFIGLPPEAAHVLHAWTRHAADG